MNLLDWCLVLITLAYALSGYWQGFITGAFATVGLVLGGLFGIWLAPHLLGDVDPSLWVSLTALFVVLVCASFGQAILQYAGSRARDTITWQPVRSLDAVGGAVLSVVAVLVVTWMLGVAIFLLSEMLWPLHHLVRIALGGSMLIAGIWVSGRLGLSEEDKKALGKTGRRLRLI